VLTVELAVVASSADKSAAETAVELESHKGSFRPIREFVLHFND
jgi:hypothetical protein